MFISRLFAAAALAATLVVPAAAFAQQAPAAPMPAMSPMPGHHHTGRRGGWRRMLATLDLSAAQKQQIDAAFAQSKAANQNVTDPATRKANRDKLHAQIEAVLTPAQRTKLQGEVQRAHQGHGRDGNGPVPMPSGTPRP